MQLSPKLHTELRRFSHILLSTDQPEYILFSPIYQEALVSDGYDNTINALKTEIKLIFLQA